MGRQGEADFGANIIANRHGYGNPRHVPGARNFYGRLFASFFNRRKNAGSGRDSLECATEHVL